MLYSQLIPLSTCPILPFARPGFHLRASYIIKDHVYQPFAALQSSFRIFQRTAKAFNMETSVNRIEDYMRKMKHTTWGFVIYRCTYASNEEFASFISSIRTSATDSFEDSDAQTSPIAQQLSWKIIEDHTRLNGASKAEVRQIFDEWCQSTEPPAEQPEAVYPVAESQNARYRFCVQIDQASLDSFKSERDPWVNVVMRKWPYALEDDDDDDDDEDGEEEEEEDRLEEIEGSTEEDVGWCKVRTISLQPSCFSTLCGANAWYMVYQRPPLVAW